VKGDARGHLLPHRTEPAVRSYARGRVACGGLAYRDDTLGECYELCESTTGAWRDDLDTLCIDACSCSDAREICDMDCADSSDADCFEQCAGETP
jgi:hypothetical protein